MPRFLLALLLVLGIPACDDPSAVDGIASGLEGLSSIPGFGALGVAALLARKLSGVTRDLSGPSRSAEDVAAARAAISALRALVERQAAELAELRARQAGMEQAALAAGFVALAERRQVA